MDKNKENIKKNSRKKGSSLLPDSFLNKLYKITNKYQLYDTITIIRIYNKNIKKEYKDFKNKISSILNINYYNTTCLYKKYAEIELMEIGIFFFSKNLNKPKKEITKYALKEIKRKISKARIKFRINQKICPFCGKSLIYINRHFFGVRKSSKGCIYFYNSLLSLKNFNQQIYFYFQTFKYLYDSLENLEFTQFEKVIKKNIKNNKIEYNLLTNRVTAIKFSNFLHKLFDNFKHIIKINNKNTISEKSKIEIEIDEEKEDGNYQKNNDINKFQKKNLIFEIKKVINVQKNFNKPNILKKNFVIKQIHTDT